MEVINDACQGCSFVIRYSGIRLIWCDILHEIYPVSKVHGAIMGPIWGRQDPGGGGGGGGHVGPMKCTILTKKGLRTFKSHLTDIFFHVSTCLYQTHTHKHIYHLMFFLFHLILLSVPYNKTSNGDSFSWIAVMWQILAIYINLSTCTWEQRTSSDFDIKWWISYIYIYNQRDIAFSTKPGTPSLSCLADAKGSLVLPCLVLLWCMCPRPAPTKKQLPYIVMTVSKTGLWLACTLLLKNAIYVQSVKWIFVFMEKNIISWKYANILAKQDNTRQGMKKTRRGGTQKRKCLLVVKNTVYIYIYTYVCVCGYA